MMSLARIFAAKMHNAWKRYDAEMSAVRESTQLVIRLAELPPRERGTEKIRATISQAYSFESEGADPHAPMLVIECDRDYPGSSFHGMDRPRIRLTEAEAVDLGRFIRKNFGE